MTREQTGWHLWKAWIYLPSLGRNCHSQFRVKRNRTTKTVTENFTVTRIDTKPSALKSMTTSRYSSTSPSSHFRNSIHRSDIRGIPETLCHSVTGGREASLVRTPKSHSLALSDSINIMTSTKASSSARALIQKGSRRLQNFRANR